MQYHTTNRNRGQNREGGSSIGNRTGTENQEIQIADQREETLERSGRSVQGECGKKRERGMEWNTVVLRGL
jgi:hypothetical protein